MPRILDPDSVLTSALHKIAYLHAYLLICTNIIWHCSVALIQITLNESYMACNMTSTCIEHRIIMAQLIELAV